MVESPVSEFGGGWVGIGIGLEEAQNKQGSTGSKWPEAFGSAKWMMEPQSWQ